MKKVKVNSVVFFMFLSFGMFAQNSTDKLPQTAQDYISQHFSSATVAEVKENSSWQIWEDEKYDVKLSNGIELDFDKNGNILEIESDRNEAIPNEALPSSIVTYLESNYPNAQVVSWDSKDKGHEVELEDGMELEFDKEGTFKKID